MADFLTIETRAGVPITDREHTITPFIKSMRVQIPGFPGGLIWNRPVSVLVQSANGEEEILPVQDVTRLIQWSLAGASLLSVLVVWLISRKFPQTNDSN